MSPVRTAVDLDRPSHFPVSLGFVGDLAERVGGQLSSPVVVQGYTEHYHIWIQAPVEFDPFVQSRPSAQTWFNQLELYLDGGHPISKDRKIKIISRFFFAFGQGME